MHNQNVNIKLSYAGLSSYWRTRKEIDTSIMMIFNGVVDDSFRFINHFGLIAGIVDSV